MKHEIKLDLTGLQLSDEEVAELSERLKNHVVAFLMEKAKPKHAGMIAMGKGWIGIDKG